MLTEVMKHWALWALNSGGYFGEAVLMALESMVFPVPSEAVMPPVGMLIRQGQWAWSLAIVFASLGSLAGSLISYWIGMVGGRPLVVRFGKYFLINAHHLEMTTRWFEKRGGVTVFISRFIPVVRHFISLPAGVARMNIWRFCLYTLVGATIWNTGLMYVGYKLEQHWDVIEQYRTYVDAGVVAALMLTALVWYLLNRRPHAAPPGQPETEP